MLLSWACRPANNTVHWLRFYIGHHVFRTGNKGRNCMLKDHRRWWNAEVGSGLFSLLIQQFDRMFCMFGSKSADYYQLKKLSSWTSHFYLFPVSWLALVSWRHARKTQTKLTHVSVTAYCQLNQQRSWKSMFLWGISSLLNSTARWSNPSL